MTELVVIVIAALVTRMYSTRILLSGETINVFDSISGSMAALTSKTYGDCKQIIDRSFSKSKSYEIKHIFLIDRASGIQIEEVSSTEAGILNGDAISAMFSAIQSFVQDAFSHERSSKLTAFRVGDHSIRVAHGPQLMLACVVVGKAPKALKTELDHTLQIIQSEYIESLSDLGKRECVEGLSKLMNTLLAEKTPMTLSGSFYRLSMSLR